MTEFIWRGEFMIGILCGGNYEVKGVFKKMSNIYDGIFGENS